MPPQAVGSPGRGCPRAARRAVVPRHVHEKPAAEHRLRQAWSVTHQQVMRAKALPALRRSRAIGSRQAIGPGDDTAPAAPMIPGMIPGTFPGTIPGKSLARVCAGRNGTGGTAKARARGACRRRRSWLRRRQLIGWGSCAPDWLLSLVGRPASQACARLGCHFLRANGCFLGALRASTSTGSASRWDAQINNPTYF
jgi:hypothetical protein